MKTEQNFLMSDVYDYLFENPQFIGTNFCDEFPESYIDEDDGIVYLCKKPQTPLFKITMEKL